MKVHPKYWRIRWDGDHNVAFGMKDDKELKECLKDGSLQDGDIIYEVIGQRQVVEYKTLKLVEKGKYEQ